MVVLIDLNPPDFTNGLGDSVCLKTARTDRPRSVKLPGAMLEWIFFRRVDMRSRGAPTQVKPPAKMPAICAVMRARIPLTPDRIKRLSLIPYVAFDWMVRRGVCEDSVLVLLQDLFLSEALCLDGHLTHARAIAVEGQKRLADLYKAGLEKQQWALDDETYRAVQSSLSVYVAQLPLVSEADVKRAFERIASWRGNNNGGT